MQRQGEMLPANAYKSNHDAKLFGFTDRPGQRMHID
jgi:hypothetical protein